MERGPRGAGRRVVRLQRGACGGQIRPLLQVSHRGDPGTGAAGLARRAVALPPRDGVHRPRDAVIHWADAAWGRRRPGDHLRRAGVGLAARRGAGRIRHDARPVDRGGAEVPGAVGHRLGAAPARLRLPLRGVGHGARTVARRRRADHRGDASRRRQRGRSIWLLRAAYRRAADHRGVRLQAVDGPVPDVDAGRVRRSADAGGRVPVGGEQGGGVRGVAARALRGAGRGRAERRLGRCCWPCWPWSR